MIIGKDPNNDIYKLLLAIAQLADNKVEQRIEITLLKEQVDLDVAEFKHILGYLTERGWISVDSIGGPLLYDKISITKDGLDKAQSIREK